MFLIFFGLLFQLFINKILYIDYLYIFFFSFIGSANCVCTLFKMEPCCFSGPKLPDSTPAPEPTTQPPINIQSPVTVNSPIHVHVGSSTDAPPTAIIPKRPPPTSKPRTPHSSKVKESPSGKELKEHVIQLIEDYLSDWDWIKYVCWVVLSLGVLYFGWRQQKWAGLWGAFRHLLAVCYGKSGLQELWDYLSSLRPTPSQPTPPLGLYGLGPDPGFEPWWSARDHQYYFPGYNDVSKVIYFFLNLLKSFSCFILFYQ